MAQGAQRRRIMRRINRAGVTLSAPVLDRLVAYYELLELWNRKINLTAEVASDAAVDRLLVEPMVAAQSLPGHAAAMIDIGSGSGSPAIPMKLSVPAVDLVMVESKTRKAAFLREVVRQLAMGSAVVETQRFEDLLFRPDLRGAMDVVTIRAVRVDHRALSGLQAFLRPGGQIFLFGGSTIPVRDAIPPPLALVGATPLVEPLRSKLYRLVKAADLVRDRAE